LWYLYSLNLSSSDLNDMKKFNEEMLVKQVEVIILNQIIKIIGKDKDCSNLIVSNVSTLF